MFSLAMTSGLVSDSDEFKIITTLRRAQKFGDTRPYKNFIISEKRLWTTWSGGVSAQNGTMKCRRDGLPEMVTPASRTTAVWLFF